MQPKLMDMFKDLRNTVSSGFDKGEVTSTLCEDILHHIYDLEKEVKNVADGDYVYEQNQLMLLRGIKNELHDLNKNLNKRR